MKNLTETQQVMLAKLVQMNADIFFANKNFGHSSPPANRASNRFEGAAKMFELITPEVKEGGPRHAEYIDYLQTKAEAIFHGRN